MFEQDIEPIGGLRIVMVDDWPAANIPMAQMYVHTFPKRQPKKAPPLNKLDSMISVGSLPYLNKHK